MARHAHKANMPDRMSSVRSRRVRTAIALAAIVRKAACHAAQTPAPVAMARKALVPVAGRPFLAWQFAWLARGGVTDVHLAAGTSLETFS